MKKARSTRKNSMVVILEDGSRYKGIADDFRPDRAFTRLKEFDLAGNLIEIHEIDTREICVAFFVHDLAIQRTHRVVARRKKGPDPPANGGRRVRVTLTWGEVMDGIVRDNELARHWFYLRPLTPAERTFNIRKVYIGRQAVAKIEALDAKERTG